MNSLELSSKSDEELNSLELEGKTFGVIGVCGIIGNLVARVLMDNGYSVIGTDMSNEADCRFKDSFDNYDIEIFYGGHPKTFFDKIDYIFVPPSLPETAKVFDFIHENNVTILELGDIFKLFPVKNPVICIGGTNGKTTTTTLLKHIAYSGDITPTEHNLKGMQGNNEFIPSLQTRLNGDLSILETGTDGTPGGLKSILDLTNAGYAILTNITPDHLDKGQSFIDYAKVKGELVQGIQEHNGTLIYNADDPTIIGLLNHLNYTGNSISFGLDLDSTDSTGYKPCWCNKDIEINEIISGCGRFNCDCGIKYKKPDYIATNISLKDKSFTLISPDDQYDFTLAIDGLHNIYNAVGAIIASKVFLNLSNDQIQKALSTFHGADGRMQSMGEVNGKKIMIDYAHNPAGVQTILTEITKIYGDSTVVITVTSESGSKGDFEILDHALGHIKHIVPASHDSRIAAEKLLNLSKENKVAYDYNYLSDTFVFTPTSPEQKTKSTLGASEEQVITGLKSALKTDVNLIICIGEAAFKFSPAIKSFCENN